MELFLAAYLDLQGDRSGMGDGRIPWTAVQSYCVANEFEDDLTDDAHFYVRALDNAWLPWAKSKRENSTPASPGKK